MFEIMKLRPRGSCITSQHSSLSLAAVVYLAEDLHWNEDLVSEVVAVMKDFTGRQRIKAGYSYTQGSPTLGYA